MNERIQKLVEQSGGEFWQRLENDAVNPEAYITFDPPGSLEKFVNLIVEECCEVLINEGNKWHEFAKNPPEGQGNVAGAALFAAFRLKEDAVDAVQEHFGVNGMSTEDKKTLIKELLGVNK